MDGEDLVNFCGLLRNNVLHKSLVCTYLSWAQWPPCILLALAWGWPQLRPESGKQGHSYTLRSKLTQFSYFYVNNFFSADATMCRKSNSVLVLIMKARKNTLKSRIIQKQCRNFQYCQIQPGLPRQLKTQIAFSIFTILEANLWFSQSSAKTT